MFVSASYRPIRVGFCVRHNLQQIESAVRISHLLWGGRYNPLIPIDQPELAKALVRLYEVDALHAIDESTECSQFVNAYPHLKYPVWGGALLTEEDGVTSTRPLGVRTLVRHVRRRKARDRDFTPPSPILLDVTSSDPLRVPLLCTFGGYPTSPLGNRTKNEFVTALDASVLSVAIDEALPADLLRTWSPTVLTTLELSRDRSSGWDDAGFFIGDSLSPADLISYWNLRASDTPLLFIDEAHIERFALLIEAFAEQVAKSLRSSAYPESVGLWSTREDTQRPDWLRQVRTHQIAVDDALFNGLNVQPPLPSKRAPVRFVQRTESGKAESLDVTVDFPLETDGDEEAVHQDVVISFGHVSAPSRDENATFFVPNIPQLNSRLREISLVSDGIRTQREGFGVITQPLHTTHYLQPLPSLRIFEEIFRLGGWTVSPSHPGKIARRIVGQFGGLQGARILKIPGVRTLLSTFGPETPFAGATAKQHLTRELSAVGDLIIEGCRVADQTSEWLLAHLVSRGVLRLGATLRCASCELQFWTRLDDLRSTLSCEYCGRQFNAAAMLDKRSVWQYRRSGIFGASKEQQGGIPVVLALQSLNTALLMRHEAFVFATGLDFRKADSPRQVGEIDFAVLTQTIGGRVQLGIGEAKTSNLIERQDIALLDSIADTLSEAPIDVFRIFAKTSAFSADELSAIAENRRRFPPRVILLGPKELALYDYSHAIEAESGVRRRSYDLEGLAQLTSGTYLKPQAEGLT